MPNVIAIDGPSYVGKSTTAHVLADLMGYTHINTGHMYRAVARGALRRGLCSENVKDIASLAARLNIRFESKGRSSRTIVNGEDLTESLDALEIVSFASKIAMIPELRQVLTDMQCDYARGQKAVLEGRDIGSVVFPDARWKFFITASTEVRARRMQKIVKETQSAPYPDVKALIPKIVESDKNDLNREIAPLIMTEDAILYDNSDSPSEHQDALILQYYVKHTSEILRNAHLLIKKIR